MSSHRLLLVILANALGAATRIHAQGTSAISYHGQLSDNGQPARGCYDLTFTVYDYPVVGTAVGRSWTNAATVVTNGTFDVMLDFGAAVFTGPARWLELGVRTNGGTDFTVLTPRQAVTPIPYALTASNLSGTLPTEQLAGALPAAQISGTLPLAALPAAVLSNTATGVTLNGSFTGDFTGDARSLVSLPVYADEMAKAAPVPPLCYVTWWDLGDPAGTVDYSNMTESNILAVAGRWATNGMLAAGFDTIWLDDGWTTAMRAANGDLVAHPVRFPHGMAWLAQSLHQLGFKAGIYTCYDKGFGFGYSGFQVTPAALAQQHMNQFASWGFDAVTVDAPWPFELEADKRAMLRIFTEAALNAAYGCGRTNPMMLRFGLNWPLTAWEARYDATVWFDGGPAGFELRSLAEMVSTATRQQAVSWAVGPGHYQEMNSWSSTVYADTNNGVAAMSLSAIMATYVNTSDVSADKLFIFTNREVLKVLQDPAVIPGSLAWSNALAEVWVRPLGGRATGQNAVALVNLSGSPQTVPLNWAELPGVPSGAAVAIRDLWNHTNVYTGPGPWSNAVPPNSVQLFGASLQSSGVTTNISVLTALPSGFSTLCFSNGVLVKIQ
jgi:hypothetical protein